MNLSRYLIDFSYVGTYFSGVALQKNASNTVCNKLQESFESLADICELKSKVSVSSRTDAGVHAISNTCHLDLKLSNQYLDSLGNKNLETDSKICKDFQNKVNEIFIENNDPIRINEIKKVNPEFNSRHAISRTYIYRLALSENGEKHFKDYLQVKRVNNALAKNKNLNQVENIPDSFYLLRLFPSVLENNFVTEIREPFNFDLFLKAIELFKGQHNFSAFTTVSGREEMKKSKKNPIKTVELKVRPNETQFLKYLVNEKYKIIEVEITSSSFLYKMIRKIVGAAVDVAKNSIPLKQIQDMFLCPPDYYNANLTTVLSPNGLFLKKVNYDLIK